MYKEIVYWEKYRGSGGSKSSRRSREWGRKRSWKWGNRLGAMGGNWGNWGGGGGRNRRGGIVKGE